ncbi:MAG: hypothetical protein AAFR11_01655 [Pseudomonadota bacterium]
MRRLAPLAALVLAACATATPYTPANDRGYGFSEQRIEQDRFRITFSGNSLTDRSTVETYLLFRAAELTIQNDYDFFQLVENDTETQRTYTSSGAAIGGVWGPRGFPGYYAYGWGWGGFPYDARIREIRRYSATAYIVMGRGPKPADNVLAYDARDVMQNLSTSIVRP